ncbi:MOSC domain-containing protein [Jatrophihabitans sp. YIM 134969]
MQATVESLNIGAVGAMANGARTIVTAYNKSPVDHALPLGRLGFPGDEHVYEHHGGPDKAVCVYAREHYAHWEDVLGTTLPTSAAFGENFTTTGLVETDVHLGDVFAVGDAVVQVTGPRAPCYKIAARYGEPKMAVYVQQRGYTGYLMRVLTEGEVAPGAVMSLVDRQAHGITVAEANRVLNVDRRDVDGAARILAVPDLSEAIASNLRARIAKHGDPEDVERLFGDAD